MFKRIMRISWYVFCIAVGIVVGAYVDHRASSDPRTLLVEGVRPLSEVDQRVLGEILIERDHQVGLLKAILIVYEGEVSRKDRGLRNKMVENTEIERQLLEDSEKNMADLMKKLIK